MLSTNKKIEHLKSLGFSGDFSEVIKMYDGKEFNCNDTMYKAVINYSEELCDEFSRLCPLVGMEGNIGRKAQERQKQILDILFPGHGMLFGGREGLRTVIGLVDIGGMNYLNANINFGKSSRVHLGEYVFVANNVTFGSDNTNQEINKLSEINIKPDTWICAGVNIADNTIVSGQSVVALGSNITEASLMEEGSIIAGNPGITKHIIDPNFQPVRKKINPNRTVKEVRDILAHIRSLGIDGDMSQYIRQLENKEYNTLEPTISKIFDLSHNLSAEFNAEGTSSRRRQEILDILFFMHGANLKIDKGLNCDILGTVKIGNDVTIGKNSALCGNIEIGNGVILGDNCLLQAIGHKTHYLGRRLSFDGNGAPVEINVPTFLQIVDNIRVGSNSKIAGGNIITSDIEVNTVLR